MVLVVVAHPAFQRFGDCRWGINPDSPLAGLLIGKLPGGGRFSAVVANFHFLKAARKFSEHHLDCLPSQLIGCLPSRREFDDRTGYDGNIVEFE